VWSCGENLSLKDESEEERKSNTELPLYPNSAPQRATTENPLSSTDDTGASTKDAVIIAGVKGRITPGWRCHDVPLYLDVFLETESSIGYFL